MEGGRVSQISFPQHSNWVCKTLYRVRNVLPEVGSLEARVIALMETSVIVGNI
jgi:hypothetical protein